ncbi:formylglycine-generating enzyme family protein [Primorskyibacter sp. 2E233]|uniref:formylglycine-generating enzyme family protein n=1 Tax=Primorskyibacter sp. 2E233 TaxID=3413431 RepID=UPI003BF0A528
MNRPVIFPLLAALVAGAWWLMPGTPTPPPFAPPEVVMVPAGKIEWHPLGNFSQDGKARTPQPVSLLVPEFGMMKYQVNREQYAICVQDGGCQQVSANGGALPQTQVNWQDATAFAAWYSDRTGEVWRLPTETEWQLAAAERYGDASADPDALDPGQRMLANYENGILLRGSASPTLRPQGGYGENSLGIADISGNIWEWTDGCVENGMLDPNGRILTTEAYCGVRIAGGRHRAAVINFVRDASVGGCAVGLPPDHLGFRLVRGSR